MTTQAMDGEPAVGTWLENVPWVWGDGGRSVVERRTVEVVAYYNDPNGRHVKLRAADGATMFVMAAVLVDRIAAGEYQVQSA